MSINNLDKQVKKLFNEIHAFEKGKKDLLSLPSNTYFLENGEVLCCSRGDGVSRFPYGTNGFTVWVYSSGYVSINESTFYLVLPSEEGKEPYLSFFAGEENKNKKYDYYSLLRQGHNESSVKRYCVYSKEAAYFLLETKNCRYATRIFVDENNKVCLSLYANRYRNGIGNIYLSAYINGLFKYSNCETMETKWFKKVLYENDVFTFESPEDLDRTTHVLNFGIIKRRCDDKHQEIYNTTSRSEYAGGKESSIFFSTSLQNGFFSNRKNLTHFVDTGVVGDIVRYSLAKGEYVEQDYTIEYTHDEQDYIKIKNDKEIKNLDEKLDVLKKKIKIKDNSKSMLKLSFEEYKDNKIHDKTLNKFLEYVIYQTEYCGLAKNSGALFLGVRDVMQQVEAALMWNPKACRKKIIEVMNFISPDGNPPRQYSLPPEGSNPRMDLRPFIDQGVWIISTIYAYLCYTGDYSILKEESTYYIRSGAFGILDKTKDTVLEHMFRIMNYLITHIDENTKCLRAMYGDWNDALDGLGVSNKEGVEYGNGVSIMATLQLFKNLNEMIDILSHLKIRNDLIEEYKNIKEDLVKGFEKYGIVHSNKQAKILHGWGEDRSYLVGSFNDVDNVSRDSLTANAFYYISMMNEYNFIDKKDILKAYENLDSKYGLKTFEPYFEEDVKGVGRIVHLPKGTAENGATYIHGALFGVLSLFMMGEGEKAFAQLEKLLPITHSSISTSPFVMPNSYSYNEEEDMDGESMSDWYTGSANTLIKIIVRGLFGITHSLDGMFVKPSSYCAFKKASLRIKVLKSIINLKFELNNYQASKLIVNDKEYDLSKGILLTKDILSTGKEIEILIK